MPRRAAQAARYSNGGAYPPDLSLITKARHDGTNYGAWAWRALAMRGLAHAAVGCAA